MTLRLLPILALALSSSAVAQDGRQSMLIDFGSPSRMTAGLANDITEPGASGCVLSQAQDTTGKLTTVSVSQLDGWCGVNQMGCQGRSPYPATAMEDSFYLGEAGDRSARLRIDGLAPGEPYDFTFFASRMDSDRKREAVYRIGRREATLDAANNTKSCAELTGVRAGGDGSVTIDIQCVGEGGYAYLGVLEIRGRFAPGQLTRRPPDPLGGPPIVSAKAWAIADGKTGELLWGFHEDQRRKTASTTKMMCAWVVIQLAMADPAVLDETVTFSKLADNTGGSTSGLRAGEQVSVGELLYGLLLPSGNDAGNAFAEHFNDRFAPPEDPALRDDPNLATRANFVAEMNRNARRLGMDHTTYRLPYGDGGTASQFTSTPRDLLKLAYVVMQNPLFRKYVGARRHRCEVIGPEGGRRFVVWSNTNQLLAIEGYDGVKTGTNKGAGACLVSSGRRDGDHLLVAVLGAAPNEGRYVDTRNLFRWAWLQRGHQPAASPAAPAAAAAGEKPAGEPGWTSLFDGKTLGKWEIVEKYDFKRHGKVEVKDGSLLLHEGSAGTGVRWTGEFPKMDYEVRLEGMRVEGSDFFCGMTFPVGETALTLVLGGWGGDIIGLSDINGDSAVDNETGQAFDFKNGRWYRIRLRVTKSKIEAWIDDEQIVDLDSDGLEFSLRWEMEPCLPFGFATWYTTGALRNIRVRSLVEPVEGGGATEP